MLLKNLDIKIKTLVYLKIILAIGTIFSPFTHPHIVRQADTMGVSLRYWLRWTQEPELFYPLLPAVLTAGDNYGITPMEFPLLNIIIAPLFSFELEYARMLASLAVILISLGLVYIHSRVWKGITILDVDMQKATWFLVIIGVSQMYWHRFMPDFWSFILVSMALGVSWNKLSWKLSFIICSIGLLLKPPAVIALVLLFLKKPKAFMSHCLYWIIPSITICIFYYTFGMDYIDKVSDVPSYFRVKFRNPLESVMSFISEPRLILELFLESFFTSFTFIFVAAMSIKHFVLKKELLGKSLWFFLLLQIVAIAALDGDHSFAHDYYFIGTSLVTILLFILHFERMHKYLQLLVLFIIGFYHLERGFYETRQAFMDNTWKQCKNLKAAMSIKTGDRIDSPYSSNSVLALCLGAIQNAESSPYYFEQKKNQITGFRKDNL